MLAKTARTRQPGGPPSPAQTTIVASTKIDLKKAIRLQVVASQQDEYTFNYATDGTAFQNLGGPVSGDILSTNVAGGFTGSLIGLYATKNNDITP